MVVNRFETAINCRHILNAFNWCEWCFVEMRLQLRYAKVCHVVFVVVTIYIWIFYWLCSRFYVVSLLTSIRRFEALTISIVLRLNYEYSDKAVWFCVICML